MQLLGLNVCFQLLSQHKHWKNNASHSLELQFYRHVRTGTTSCRLKLLWGENYFSELIVASDVELALNVSLSAARQDVTHLAVFQPGVFSLWTNSSLSYRKIVVIPYKLQINLSGKMTLNQVSLPKLWEIPDQLREDDLTSRLSLLVMIVLPGWGWRCLAVENCSLVSFTYCLGWESCWV
jgi:hypothetical protein